jgi:hypothetical protein
MADSIQELCQEFMSIMLSRTLELSKLLSYRVLKTHGLAEVDWSARAGLIQMLQKYPKSTHDGLLGSEALARKDGRYQLGAGEKLDGNVQIACVSYVFDTSLPTISWLVNFRCYFPCGPIFM